MMSLPEYIDDEEMKNLLAGAFFSIFPKIVTKKQDKIGFNS